MGSSEQELLGFFLVWVKSSRIEGKEEDESNFGNVGLSSRSSFTWIRGPQGRGLMGSPHFEIMGVKIRSPHE